MFIPHHNYLFLNTNSPGRKLACSPWLLRNLGSLAHAHLRLACSPARCSATRRDYLRGGSETETTLARNRASLDSIAWLPKVLVDVSQTNATSSFFGKKIRLPVALAPVGSLQSFEAGGGASVAKGASDFGVPMILSSVSEPSLESVASAGPGPKVFQLYVRGDDSFIDDHVKRAVEAGYDAFAITVDTAVISRRERDISKRWLKTWQLRYSGMEYQAGLSWAQIERFKAKHKIPLIVKGISRVDDAIRAAELGVDVVYVSNHGGRQLDHAVGSFEMLQEIVDAVKKVGKGTQVWVDGGFSRGSDVLKAVAVGADLVIIGRLYLYALAAVGSSTSPI